MSEINRVYGVNLSGIVPTSECLGDILYEETCSRSNINQNVLLDFLTCDRIKLRTHKLEVLYFYAEQLLTACKHQWLSIFENLSTEYSE
jgi:hypothetical protein